MFGYNSESHSFVNINTELDKTLLLIKLMWIPAKNLNHQKFGDDDHHLQHAKDWPDTRFQGPHKCWSNCRFQPSPGSSRNIVLSSAGKSAMFVVNYSWTLGIVTAITIPGYEGPIKLSQGYTEEEGIKKFLFWFSSMCCLVFVPNPSSTVIIISHPPPPPSRPSPFLFYPLP